MYTTKCFGTILTSTLCITLASATVTLSQFQAVTGFPQACQNAYNTPISNCDASNFPRKCSSDCFVALAQAEVLIDNSCAGQHAPFDSIIGQMFEGSGPAFMCTEDFTLEDGGGESSSSEYTDATTSFASSTTSSSSTSSTSATAATTTQSPSSSASSSKTKSTPVTPSSTHRTSTVAQLTTSSPSTSPSSPPSSSLPTTRNTNSQPLTTAFNNGAATTLTNTAQRTSAANSNPDAFGGGGSPFEVGANKGRRAGVNGWLLSLVAVAFGVISGEVKVG